MNNPTLIWFVIGAILFLLEFAIPGLVVMFFGIGAWIVSLAVSLHLVDSLTNQVLLFSVSSIISIVVLRKYLKAWFVGESNLEDEDFDEEFIGQRVKVIAAIPGGSEIGKVELKGTVWQAVSDHPHSEGEIVKVIARNGLTLTVTDI